MTDYINFVIMTPTPGELANWLIARGVMQLVNNSIGNTQVQTLVGTLPGMEWVEVPNPVITANGVPNANGPGWITPPVYDSRHCYLVKFAHESVDDQANSGVSANATNTLFEWTKVGQWIKNHATEITAPANYIINGQPAGNAYHIANSNVYIVNDHPERFGVWQ